MTNPAARATLADVAARAGVSESTASNALSGRRYVAPGTIARVTAIAREIGYRPNHLAQSLRARTSRTVAFIVNDIGNVSFTTSIRAASALLRERTFAIDMVDSPEAGPTLEIVQQVLDRVPDGVIFFGEEPTAEAIEALGSNGVPYAVGGLGAPHDSAGDVVYTDQAATVREVTTALASGVRGRICFVGGDKADEGARARLAGFTMAMEDMGRPVGPADIALVPYSIDGGIEAMRMISAEVPELVIAGSDQIAQGAMIEARAAGIDIPGHLRIVGFDNIESCRVTSPPLSSIDVRLEHQGLLCAEMLLDRIEGRYDDEARVIRVEPQFVKRESTGA